MPNSWKVIWFEGGRKLKKSAFPGDSPRASGAIDYAKSVVARGIPVENVHVVSMKRGYPPTAKAREERMSGTVWCPYCLKYREFRLSSISVAGVLGPEDYRCPVCLISTQDYFVRKYNFDQVTRMETTVPRLPKAKTVPPRRRR